MRKFSYFMIAWMVLIGMIYGCSKSKSPDKEHSVQEQESMDMQQKAVKTADEAIKFAKRLKDAEQKKDYLMNKAQTFYKSEEFNDAIKITKHVLEYVDAEASDAKQLLEKATQDLKAQTDQMLRDKAKKISEMKF